MFPSSSSQPEIICLFGEFDDSFKVLILKTNYIIDSNLFYMYSRTMKFYLKEGVPHVMGV